MSEGIKLKDTDDLKTMGAMLAKSNLFDTKDDVAKAVTKVEFGLELGLGPATSMANVHVVKGKPALSAHVMSAKVKQSSKYNYTVEKHNEKGCKLQFYEKMGEEWKESGTSKFTIKDAKQAGLDNKSVWKKYPKNLLFARAMSNGVKWYCPDLLIAGAYTPEELDGQDVANESMNEQQAQEVVNEAEEVQETEFEIQESDNDSDEKSTDNDQSEASESDSDGSDSSSNGNSESDVSDTSDNHDYLSDKQLKKLNTIGSKFYDLQKWNDKTWDDKRPELVSQATDGRTNSSKELTKDQANSLIENLEKQLKFYKNALENYEDDYQLAKKFASKIDGAIGKGTHDELIESINSVVTDEEDEPDESDDSEGENEDEESYEDLEF